eukprot:gene31372-27609_t
MSAEYCMCCREPDLRPRSAIDRFAALWHNEIIQKRLSTDWYKDVRKIDMGLSLAAGRIRQHGGAVIGKQSSSAGGKAEQQLQQQQPAGVRPALDLKAAYADIETLANARSALKPIQKAAARVTQINGSPTFYVDGIISSLAECVQAVGVPHNKKSQSSPSDTQNALLSAISNCNRKPSTAATCNGGSSVGTSASSAGSKPPKTKHSAHQKSPLSIGSAVGKKPRPPKPPKSAKKSSSSSSTRKN